VIHFSFLADSSGIIEEVGISTVKPNMAGFDQIETMFKLPVKNISQDQ
jgi:hypothetical protein